MKIFIISLTVFLILVIAFIFGVYNEQLVTVNYFLAQQQLRLSQLFAIAMGFGFIVSSLLFAFLLIKKNLAIRLLQAKIRKLENQQGS